MRPSVSSGTYGRSELAQRVGIGNPVCETSPRFTNSRPESAKLVARHVLLLLSCRVCVRGDRRLWNRADRGPSFKSSPVSRAGIGDDDLRRSCDSFIPRMSVTAASAPHSTIGSGTRWDRAVSFRKGLVEGSGENQRPASRRFRSTPTVPDDRQTPQPALTGPRSRLPQSITEMILSRRPNRLLHPK